MNDEQLLRYSRHLMLPELDVAGQEKLLAAHVAIVGLGGLGSPAALYLAAAGVGRVTLVDDDAVELSNLQRQIAHRTASIGRPKTASAAEAVSAINPDVVVATLNERLDARRAVELAAATDVIIDATDNFTVRYDLNDASRQCRTPLVSGAAIRLEGQVAVFDPRDDGSPCYRCLYPEGDDEALNCAENGVFAPLVGIIGTVQALEAAKLVAGMGTPLTGYVLYLDAATMEWNKFRLRRRAGCPACGVEKR